MFWLAVPPVKPDNDPSRVNLFNFKPTPIAATVELAPGDNSVGTVAVSSFSFWISTF